RQPEATHFPYTTLFRSNGHPLGMAAGLATLEVLTPAVYEELNRKGEWVRGRLREVFEAHDIAAQVTGIGSLFNIHFTSVPVRDQDRKSTRLNSSHVAIS